jgi:hypothetical protein
MSRFSPGLRAFISVLTALSFLLMALTGAVAFLMPEGRVAYWVDWRLVGLAKDDWGSLHLFTSVLFLGAGGAHLVLNWKSFLSHLKGRVSQGWRRRRELGAALAVCVLVMAGSLRPFPPFTWVLSGEKWTKATWIKSPEHEPPYGHAEQTSLSVFAKKMQIDLPPALEELAGAGIRVEHPSWPLEKIAQANQISPAALYRILKRHQRPDPEQARSFATREEVEEAFTGTGVGNRTLDQICEGIGLAPEVARNRLARAGVPASPGETLKAAAERHGLKPIDLLSTALLEGT